MAGMPTEETSTTEAFKIRMTCIHTQLQQLNLFHVFTANKSKQLYS